MKTPRQLKKLYEQGHNISSLLRSEKNISCNDRETIEISYDLQTGSYINGIKFNKELAARKEKYTAEVAAIIQSLADINSVMEAGVGEATTLRGVLQHLNSNIMSYGFDLSWSRLAYARDWLQKGGQTDTVLCSGDLFNIPFLDNSIDIVYTTHSIEPNRGNEETILKELYRVAKKYVILLEPAYEFANEAVKKRMDHHGYCTNLLGTSESLGYDVIEYKLFPYSANPLNPTAMIIIRKSEQEDNQPSTKHIFACPKNKSPLIKYAEGYYSQESLVLYPIIGGIPCLRIENGIFASKYEEMIKPFV